MSCASASSSASSPWSSSSSSSSRSSPSTPAVDLRILRFALRFLPDQTWLSLIPRGIASRASGRPLVLLRPLPLLRRRLGEPLSESDVVVWPTRKLGSEEGWYVGSAGFWDRRRGLLIAAGSSAVKTASDSGHTRDATSCRVTHQRDRYHPSALSCASCFLATDHTRNRRCSNSDPADLGRQGRDCRVSAVRHQHAVTAR